MTDSDQRTLLTPATNPFIKGAERIKQSFIYSLKDNPVKSQSLLLTGPKGVGKMTLAYHLARYVFQAPPRTFDLDAKDRLFQRIAHGAHGDLKVVQLAAGKREISIEAIREMVRFTQSTAFDGGWRVAIVDSVDDLTIKASNALLKTLEEPPRQTLLILIAHHLGRVLPTVRSRCVLYKMSPLTASNMTDVLNTLMPATSSADKDFLIQQSRGCPGLALELITLGGGAFYTTFLKMMSDLAENSLAAVYDLIHELDGRNNPDVYDLFFTFFLRWWSTLFSSTPSSQHQDNIIKAKLQHCFSKSMIAKIHQHGTDRWAAMTNLKLEPRAVLLCFFYELMTGQLPRIVDTK